MRTEGLSVFTPVLSLTSAPETDRKQSVAFRFHSVKVVLLLEFIFCQDSETRWSECSRSCDTGLTNRTIPCLKTDQSCSGIKYQFKLCNRQPCLDNSIDSRHQQCQKFNSKPFHGETHQWVPLLDTNSPCALICRSGNVTVTFSEKVENGTKCRDRGDDVCIGGTCMSVGCDDIIGSGLSVDKCGVCGGTGSCSSQYSWLISWSSCSVSCGTGLQRSKSSCTDHTTNMTVSDKHCPVDGKLSQIARECYTDCTNGLVPVCEGGNCQEWTFKNWSQCSVTCGKGFQFRAVSCKHGPCSGESKPTNRRICYTGIICAQKDEDMLYYPSDEAIPDYPTEMTGEVDDKPRYITGEWNTCSVTCGVGIKTRTVECQTILPETKNLEVVKDEECYEDVRPNDREECQLDRCINENMTTTVINIETTTAASESYSWNIGGYGECSKSCLEGERLPFLDCIYSITKQTVDKIHCEGLVPPVVKPTICNDHACPPRWEVGDYGPCTVECGGGVQERPVECIEERSLISKVPVESHRCPGAIPMSKRNCNTQFCPARWMTRDWSKCSTSCGVGIQNRRAFCVKSPIVGRQVTVSDTECMGPKPITSRECHLGKCFGTEEPPPIIKSENYTYVQFRRSKRVRLIVGGKVVLLPGQSTVIKCPVKHFQRKLIFWSKGYKLIPMMAGRIHTTFSGNLKLRKTKPEIDAGVYTCSAGLQSASVTIVFQSKRDAFKKAREMKKILREANKKSNLVLPINDEAAGGQAAQDPRYNATKQLIFTSGSWSPCSQTCGSGQQTREVKCTRITHKYMKMLSDRECKRWGLTKPISIQKCLVREDCPSWEIGEWSKCNKKQCVRDGYGQKKRPLHCIHSNGTRAPLDVCAALERPQHKEECRSFDCYSVWRTTKWTECLPRCAKKGYKSRILTCIWKRSKLPAWSACKGKPRPITRKTCSPRPCVEECADKSRYCNLVGMLKMCRYSNFRFNCCATCKAYLQRNS
ncbi:hypothetical protein LOTGIDRAFT_152088 [Lottia gigantea]|uniref:PLAC domain-containing protein n=1 Tax=Lottia gigantea TaxID=225164 RepID=V4BH38_LOTGI|nr:hypothetical protein LOTGIDRAFT_152088 [Lottia gigantea]ESP05262.1 hypothetical protein LOTGIDRAFT_152088 [Lottia gigantea]